MITIGHRGCAGLEPENTMRAFKRALKLNVDFIEFDVRMSRDKQLVVIHDDKVDRTTNEKGYVFEKSFQELRKLDAGKGEKIPTLQEVLDLIDKKVKVNIELKGEKIAKPVFGVIEEYVKEKGWSYGDFLISSFNHYELREFKKLNPEIKIGALITGIPIGFAEFAEKVNAYSVHLSIEFINKEFVQDAHKRGMKVFVWTVNNIDDIERMKKLNIDGIFSNFPDRI